MREAILVLAVVLVVGSASVASAECAWVLWLQTGTVDTGGGWHWGVENAFPTQAECAAMRDEEFQLVLMAFQQDEDVTNLKRDQISASYMYDKKGQGHIGKYVCLPDTIDPREKKD